MNTFWKIIYLVCPRFWFRCMNICPLVATFQFEITFFQTPFTVVTNKCQITAFQLHGYGFGFTRIEFEFFRKLRKRMLSGVLLATKSFE